MRPQPIETKHEDLPLFAPYDLAMNASAASGAKWTPLQMAAVDDAIRKCAAAGKDFTADDVWALIPIVPVTKGLAGRLNAAAKRGLIQNTGRLTHAKRGGSHDHRQRLTIWGPPGPR